ncbi:MAG: prepilin peptidase [Anaerolineales bacterium]|nr:prepilin peptidase [Anaerolineales bacterium]
MIIWIVLAGAAIGLALHYLSEQLPRLTHGRARQTAVSPRLSLALSITFTAAAFAIQWLQNQPLAAPVFCFLWLISLIDLKYRLVPNLLVYPALVVVLLHHLLLRPYSLAALLLGGGMAFAIFALTAWLRPGDLGGGDVKLATLIGFAFGFPDVLWALILGIGLGGAAAILLFLRTRNLKLHIPYAPFLCLGAWIALLYTPWHF